MDIKDFLNRGVQVNVSEKILMYPKLMKHYFPQYRGAFSSGPGISGLVIFPNGDEWWLNGKPPQVTSQLSFNGPIMTKVREYAIRQSRVVVITFGDEELFRMQPWWSHSQDGISNNGFVWVRDGVITDHEKYASFIEIFGDPDMWIALSPCYYNNEPSYPNVRLIPWCDDVYQHGPYENLLARDLSLEVPFEEKFNKVIYRAGGFLNHVNCAAPRLKVLQMLKKYDWANVGHREQSCFVPIREQAKYKVILMVDDTAPSTCVRWAWLVKSVIVRISDWSMCVTDKMKPWEDYVPVKTDLSDLIENIQWIFNNLEKARKIAEHGCETYVKYARREQLDKVIEQALL